MRFGIKQQRAFSIHSGRTYTTSKSLIKQQNLVVSKRIAATIGKLYTVEDDQLNREGNVIQYNSKEIQFNFKSLMQNQQKRP